jgi:copper chaperone
MIQEFTLPNLSCGHCVNAVTQAVRNVDPQARVAVELERRRVRIESVETASRFRQALDEAGYPVASSVGKEDQAGAGTSN